MAANFDTWATNTEIYCSMEDVSFSRLRKNAVIKEDDNDFVQISNESKIIDFGVAQSWISEDLVIIEPRIAGKTVAQMITASGENMKITGVTIIQCIRAGKNTTFNCLITPDLKNSIVLSYKEALNIGAVRNSPFEETALSKE